MDLKPDPLAQPFDGFPDARYQPPRKTPLWKLSVGLLAVNAIAWTAIAVGVLLVICLAGCAPSLDCRASWAGVATAHDLECAHAAAYGAWR